jgi:hypothetical protein
MQDCYLNTGKYTEAIDYYQNSNQRISCLSALAKGAIGDAAQKKPKRLLKKLHQRCWN